MLTTRLLTCILLAFVSAASSVRAGPLEELINSRLPAASPNQQRQRAIDTAFETLRRASDLNVAAGINLADVQKILLERPDLKRAGVTSIEVAGQDQVLDVTLMVERTVDGTVIPEGFPQLKSFFNRVRPEVRARIAFGMAVHGIAVPHGKNENLPLSIQLLPIFRNLSVERIAVKTGAIGELFGRPQVEVTGAADALVQWVNGHANQISEALTQAQIARIIVPASPFVSDDINHLFDISERGGAKFTFKLNGKPLSLPYKLTAASAFIGKDGITILAGISQSPEAKAPGNVDAPAAAPTFAHLTTLVGESLQHRFAVTERPSGTWVAVRKALVADILNTAFLQAHLCVAASAELPQETFAKKVSLPSADKIDCTPSKKCDQPHDRRECNKCLASVLGKCQLRGNDPFCEAEKASQNAIYASNKAACEIEKESIKTACEGKKAIVTLAAQTGALANVKGSFGPGSGSLSACFQQVTFGPSLEKVDLKLLVGGQGTADTALEFTPLGVAGHLTCQAPWREHRRVAIKVPNQEVKVSGSVKHALGAEGRLKYLLEIRTSEIAAQVRPSPREILRSSYNMQISCAPAGLLVNTFPFNVGPEIPELEGNVRLPGQELRLSYDASIVNVSLGGKTAKARFEDNGTALTATVNFP